jgi:CubicO group peptidase (beta-lactamase class C family)
MSFSSSELLCQAGANALIREIGAQFEYSNVGASLLGHALSRRAGMEYELLVRQRITMPLSMA